MVVVVVIVVEELEEQEALLSADVEISRAARLPLLDPAEMLSSRRGVGVDVEGDEAVGELAGGDPDDDLWDEEGEFTGFKMQRLTCLFRLDATPKRRPHVSHTKASR